MPNPLELLIDPISLAILGMYAFLMTWESYFPAEKLVPIKYWRVRGIISFVIFFYLSSYIPLIIDPFLSAYQLIDLGKWNALAAAATGIFCYELLLYGWHWAMHKSDTLWRVFHQMHHSAERMDTFGAFYFSPMDMIGFTLLGSICFALLIGLSPQAITIVLLLTNFMAIFQHANIKTPRWIGYILQRPESHSVHHAKGVHHYNYSDLPVFDILFGTFHNPRSFEKETGFFIGGSSRVRDMILFRDINKI
jgi:sterol desaturase/sphingolipid hydroxylase (fatty acid hydroxylase superfamily)